MSEILVRDKTPANIERRWGVVSYRLPAGEEEFLQFLFCKLGEEYYEYIKNGDLAELARLLEVIRSLAQCFGTSTTALRVSSGSDHALACAEIAPRKVRYYLYGRLESEMYAFVKSRDLQALANMLSTMDVLSEYSGSDMEYIEWLADEMKRDNGGFEKRYILTI